MRFELLLYGSFELDTWIVAKACEIKICSIECFNNEYVCYEWNYCWKVRALKKTICYTCGIQCIISLWCDFFFFTECVRHFDILTNDFINFNLLFWVVGIEVIDTFNIH